VIVQTVEERASRPFSRAGMPGSPPTLSPSSVDPAEMTAYHYAFAVRGALQPCP